ncbi:MAG: hypothetical protein JSU04_02640 [Bdellovibrionales bacterium]|nr:hypothetical protein [Bdellovibrionales bacterium]
MLKSSLLCLPFLMCIAVSLDASAAAHESIRTAAPMGAPAVETAKTKSFREWKSEKVQDALGKVTATKTKIQIAKTKDPNLNRRKGALEATSGANSETLEEQLEQDQATLEMAKDLSVTDYFVGYLTKVQDKKAAFNEVAGKLTAEEVAELMAAYANSVFGTHSSDLAPSASVLSADRVK